MGVGVHGEARLFDLLQEQWRDDPREVGVYTEDLVVFLPYGQKFTLKIGRVSQGIAYEVGETDDKALLDAGFRQLLRRQEGGVVVEFDAL